MENPNNHTEHLAEKDKNARTLFPDSLFRLWNLRILLYTLVFLLVTAFLYQEFVTEPLDRISRLNLSPYHFMWRTFNEGIGVLYFLCCLLLFIIFMMEVVVCEFCSLYGTGDEELIQISRRIRIGIIIVAVLIAGFIPFLLK